MGSRASSVKLTCYDGLQAIHLAAFYGASEIFILLAKEDPASLRKGKKQGAIALHYACANLHQKIIDYALELAEKGIDVGVNVSDFDEKDAIRCT